MPKPNIVPVEIRTLDPADSDRARELFVASAASMKTELPNDQAHRDLNEYVKSVLASDMADPYLHYVANGLKSTFWIASVSDEVVGTAAIYPFKGESEVAEVFRVSVDDRFRRLGIASRLMDTLENWASRQGYAQLMLLTTDFQHAAVGLYENRGYIVTRSGQYGSLGIKEYRKALAK